MQEKNDCFAANSATQTDKHLFVSSLVARGTARRSQAARTYLESAISSQVIRLHGVFSSLTDVPRSFTVQSVVGMEGPMPATSFELVALLLIAALAGLAALFAALCFFRMGPQTSPLTEQSAGRESSDRKPTSCGPRLEPGARFAARAWTDIGQFSGRHP